MDMASHEHKLCTFPICKVYRVGRGEFLSYDMGERVLLEKMTSEEPRVIKEAVSPHPESPPHRQRYQVNAILLGLLRVALQEKVPVVLGSASPVQL